VQRRQQDHTAGSSFSFDGRNKKGSKKGSGSKDAGLLGSESAIQTISVRSLTFQMRQTGCEHTLRDYCITSKAQHARSPANSTFIFIPKDLVALEQS
jgi:hypothetical protein